MSATELFVLLVAVAFIGGARAARGSSSVWGLSSGVEYVVLGVVVGPQFLGVVSHGAVEGFEALLLMGLGWLLTVHGANYGRQSGKRFELRRLLPAVFSSVLCAAAIFAVALYLARHFHLPQPILLALGLAAVCTESATISPTLQGNDPSRQGGASVANWKVGTELVPIILLGAMVVSEPLSSVPVPAPVFQGLVSVLLGFLLGGIVTALIGAHFEYSELWPVLLGAVLLVVGTALRLDLPAATPSFVLGLTVSSLSRHRDELRALMNTTERQLLLPCLLLAGVFLRWPVGIGQWALVFGVLMTRGLLKAVFGLIACGGSGAPVSWSTRCLQRSSAFSIALGLVAFLRQSDDMGRTVLTASVLSVLLGDLVAHRPKRLPEPESKGRSASVLSASEELG